MLDITKPVWTRNGKPARIVCSDLKRDDGRTIIAVVDCGTWEDTRIYYPTGRNTLEDVTTEDLLNEKPKVETPAPAPKREPIVPDASFDVLNERLADIEAMTSGMYDKVENILGVVRLIWASTPAKERTTGKSPILSKPYGKRNPRK